MRLVSKPVAAMFALGAVGAGLVWRSTGARDAARRTLAGAWTALNRARTSSGGTQWRAPSATAPVSQAPTDEDVAGVLNLEDQNLTVTQRVRTNIGRDPELASLPHLNINTQEHGVVYLRGYVHTEEQRRAVETVAANTAGVSAVVNELNIEQAVNL